MNKLLIVEDDVDSQALISHIIGYMNLAHDIAGSAEQALEILDRSAKDFDAVIIDLALPGKDGWQLLSEIREDATTESLTCIAVTAFHTSKLREEAIRAGFDAYFPKPLDATNFVRELEQILA